MFQRNYKFRLYLSKAQEIEMLEVLDSCRWLYNHFLGEWKKTDKVPNKYELQATIPALVKEHPQLQNIHSKTRQYVLWQLYSNLRTLSGLKKRGKKVGRLRFKKYGRYKTFVYNQTGFKLLDNGKLHLSKIGDISIRLHRKINGEIKQVYIKHTKTGKWFAIFSVETEQEKQLSKTGKAIGIDLNLMNYLMDSDGNKVEHPHILQHLQNKLTLEQRRLSRRKKGSRNRRKQITKVARVHEKIEDRRNDFLHKLSTYYIQNYDFIAVEDLSVKDMMESAHNAKNIADSSWSTFTNMLSYKAECAGKMMVSIDPKNTTQICSRCGTYVHKHVWNRTHKCNCCGLVLDRDYNSAINILHKAQIEVGQELSELTPVEIRPLLQDSVSEASCVIETGSSL